MLVFNLIAISASLLLMAVSYGLINRRYWWLARWRFAISDDHNDDWLWLHVMCADSGPFYGWTRGEQGAGSFLWCDVRAHLFVLIYVLLDGQQISTTWRRWI